MDSRYYQDKINRLDKDIADIEKKIAAESKIEADRSSKIAAIQRSITKNTSMSSLNLKQRQMSNYNREMNTAQVRRADLQKKLADKRAERAKYSIELQKAVARENKQNELNQKKLQEQYEQRVRELTEALQNATMTQTTPHSLYDENDNAEYDVFISHASEDKETFVNDLVQALMNRGIKVWYDSQNIEWGDSLRTKIDNGLRNASFGIVVLSNNFISKGWTRYELEGLFNIEMTKGKTILPIWHNITKQQVMDFSPTLAGRMALTSAAMTPDEMADEFVRMYNSAKKK
jgi:hypothetical protein